MINMTDLDFITEEQPSAISDVNYREIRDPFGYIYITINLINGKKYLGLSTFKDGWQDYLGSGKAFKKALKKYGKENFEKHIVWICYSEEELNQSEYDLSVFLDVVESPEWYNLVFGGGTSRGWHPSEETRKKQSDKAKERFSDPTNHPMYGRPGLSGENNPQFGISPKERMDEKTYQQWYENHKSYWANPTTKGVHIWEGKTHPKTGTHLTQEEKDNLSKKAKERYTNPENHPMYGRQQTDFCKQQVGIAHRGYNNWNSNAVYCIELNVIFWGSKDAHDNIGVDASGIAKCCRGKRKTCGKHPDTGEPLHWLYVHDQIQQDGAIIPGAITLGYITQQQVDEYFENLRQKGNDDL